MPKAALLPVHQMAARKRAEQKAGKWLPDDSPRPKTRGECADMPRPCPFVGCRYHLFLQVTKTGSIQMPYGEDLQALHTMPVTCALDAADDAPMELRDVARAFDITKEGTLLVTYSAYARLAKTRIVKESSEKTTMPTTRRRLQRGRGIALKSETPPQES